MRIERTKNATRNIVFGLLLKMYQIAMPFLIRTVMIYFMGVEYLGLSSLFVSLIQVLNLAELGVSSALVYSMYKPIVEDDKKAICQLMYLYRTYYRIIGSVVAVIGLLLLPMIPRFISGSIPNGLNVYYLYLLQLSATVLSYWLFAYKNCLLNAHQRTDMISKVYFITNSVQYVLQLVVLIVIKNYYWYLIVALFTQLLTNIFTAVVVTKMYPDYHPIKGIDREVAKGINRRIRDLFTSKVGGVIVNSADTIVISAFLGLATLAVYQNYYYILNSIIGLVAIIFTSCTAGIGNSLIVESKKKNLKDLKKFTFLIVWIAGFCACCLLCLYQPFMEIWVGNEYTLGFSAVICFCVYYFVYEINQLLNLYKDAGGIWHEDRFRPLVTAISNLVMNIIAVQFFGVYGVILSTVLSTLFIGMPWLLHNLFTVLFNHNDLYNYVITILQYSINIILISILTYVLCSFIPFSGWILFILRGILCCIVPNILFIVKYHKTQEFKDSLLLISKMLGKFGLM